MENVPDDPGFDFGEGLGASIGVGASSVTGTDGVPEEVVVAVAIDSWTGTAEDALVRGTGFAPETRLKANTMYLK